jgi:hypothetical protein
VKDILVTIINKATAVYRLIVADCHIRHNSAVVTDIFLSDRNGLNPMDDILQLENRPEDFCHFKRNPRVRRF